MIKIITQTHNHRNVCGYTESFTLVYNTLGNRMPICVLYDYNYSNIRKLLAKVLRSYEEFMNFEYDHHNKGSYSETKQTSHPVIMPEKDIYHLLASHKIITKKRAKELCVIRDIILAHTSLT